MGLVIYEHLNRRAVAWNVSVEIANPMKASWKLNRLDLRLDGCKNRRPTIEWKLSSCPQPAKCECSDGASNGPTLAIHMVARVVETCDKQNVERRVLKALAGVDECRPLITAYAGERFDDVLTRWCKANKVGL